MSNANSPPASAPSPRKKWLVSATLSVGALALVAWYCFQPAPLPTPSGTVRTVEFSDGSFVQHCVSHPGIGNGALCISFDRPTGNVSQYRFVSEQGVDIDLLPPPTIDAQGLQEPAYYSLPDRQTGFVSPSGAVVVFKPGQSPTVTYLQRPATITPASPPTETPSDVSAIHTIDAVESALIGSELQLLGTETSSPTTPWGVLTSYQLKADLAHGSVLPVDSCKEVPAVSYMSHMQASTGLWHSLDMSVFRKIVDKQSLTSSDGTAIDLPVDTLNASTASRYFALAGSPRAGHLTAIRTSADEQSVEVVEIDLNAKRLSDRPPIKIPTRYINTDVSRLSPDGRYIAISSCDYRTNTLPVITRAIRSMQRATATSDLILVDLVQWRLAAAERITSSRYGGNLPIAWSRPSFDSTGSTILLPQHNRYCVIDVALFIQKTNAKLATNPEPQ